MNEETRKNFQTILDKSLIFHNGMGISVAIRWTNKEMSIFASGMSDPDNSIKMDPKMLFCICSINKTMIASIILKFTEQRKINLNDTLRQWLPEYSQFDERITIRDLLNHSSGIWDFIDHPNCMTRTGLKSTNLDRLWTAQDVIKEYYVEKVYCEPGEGCYYSSSNLILLGLIIEKITQVPLHKAFREHAINPSGLRNIHIAYYEVFPSSAKIAQPWVDFNNDGKIINMYTKPLTAYHTLPFISVYTNVEDLVKWFDLLFGGEIISDLSLEQMLRTRPESHEDWIQEYGLGIAKMYLIPDLDAYGHGGSYFGYMAAVVHVPKLDITFSLMTNDSISALPQIAGDLIPEILRIASKTD